jgi:hypothetical protein
VNAETINLIQATIVIAIAVVWLASVVVCFLKGKPWSAILGIAAVVADAFGPPTIHGLYLFNPLITIFSFLPIWGAIRLGRPDFYWGSWFYSKNWLKYMRAVRRYGKEEEYWQLVRQGPDGEEREKFLEAVLASGNKYLARSIGVVSNEQIPPFPTELVAQQAAKGEQPKQGASVQPSDHSKIQAEGTPEFFPYSPKPPPHQFFFLVPTPVGRLSSGSP